MFLYQKLIDRSSLRQGFQIPVEFHHLLKAMPGGMPQHGETRSIKIVIDGMGYNNNKVSFKAQMSEFQSANENNEPRLKCKNCTLKEVVQ